MVPEEFKVIGVVTSLFITTLKENEAVKRKRRLREMLVNEFEKLLAVFDMNFKIHFKR
jgi:hypothetical protein